jgi:hypothetical protein
MCEFDEIYYLGDCYQSFAGYYCYRAADSAANGFASYVKEEGCFDFLICAGVVVSTLLFTVSSLEGDFREAKMLICL